MEIEIVKAQNSDYNGFVECFKEVEEYHRLNAPWKFVKPEGELFSKDLFENIIGDTNSLLLVAKSNDKIIGFIVAYKKDASNIPILKHRSWIDIDNLVVLGEFRKQGIGKLLINGVENWAKELNINELELNVWDFNEGAIKFYEKGGYKVYSHKMRKVIE